MPTEKADIYTLAKFGKFEEFIKLFVKEDINKKNKNGSGLLHYAITGRKFDIALFLINNNIDVNMVNSDGQTALHLICVYSNLEVAKTILEKGGDINIRDKFGNNSMWTAVFNCKGKNYDLVEVFMQYNPDILTKNNAGRSPVDFANQINDEKLLKILRQ